MPIRGTGTQTTTSWLYLGGYERGLFVEVLQRHIQPLLCVHDEEWGATCPFADRCRSNCQAVRPACRFVQRRLRLEWPAVHGSIVRCCIAASPPHCFCFPGSFQEVMFAYSDGSYCQPLGSREQISSCSTYRNWNDLLFSPRVLCRMMNKGKDATIKRRSRTHLQPLWSAEPRPKDPTAGKDHSIEQLPSSLQCAGAVESVHVQVDTDFWL